MKTTTGSIFGLLLSAVLISLPLPALSQSPGIKSVHSGSSLINKGDTVHLLLSGYRGQIQWQKSSDSQSWADISGQTTEALNYRVDTSLFFRAKIKDENCDPVFSDTTSFVPLINGKVIASGYIDSLGGAISSPEIAVTVPPGSLSSATLVKIIERDTLYGGENQFSKTFQLTGIPTTYKGLLQVAVKYLSPLEGKSYVSCYFETTPRSSLQPVKTCNYLEAKDSSGYLVSSLDFGDGQGSELKATKGITITDVQLEVAAVSKMASALQTSDDNLIQFDFRYPSSVPAEMTQRAVRYFARISKIFSDYGFTYTARNNAKVFPIYFVNDPAATASGFFAKGFPYTINGSYIQLNYPKCSSDDEELRATVGHEFFHFIHAAYGMFDNPTWWYQEALCTFAEELLQADPAGYNSSQFLLYYNTPLNGLEAGKDWIDPNTGSANVAQHGYGMGAMIKHLIHNSGNAQPGLITGLVQKVSANNLTPVEALMTSFTDFKTSWRRYFTRFYEGDLGFITPGTIREEALTNPGLARIWTPSSPTDTVKAFEDKIFDLATQVYRVHLDKDTLDMETFTVKVSSTADINDIEVRVYKYKKPNNSPFPELLGVSLPTAKHEVSISGLNIIKKTYYGLLIVVTNSRAVKPFTGTSNVSVSMNINHCGAPILYAGKTYNTVPIGKQCWLKENLDLGTMIDGAQDQTDNGIIEKYCYDNNPANCSTYGGLYQWNEAMAYSIAPKAKGICPEGFHIPTLEEYGTLVTEANIDGNALKETGQGTGYGAGTNTSGFSALLAGNRYHYDASFTGQGRATFFWMSRNGSATHAYIMFLSSENALVYYLDSWSPKISGFSIRCLAD